MWLIDEMVKKPLIISCENAMLDMFSNFNVNISNAKDNITISPQTWAGGSVYNIMSSIHKDAMLPLGVVLLTIFLYYEFYQMVIDSNNGSDFNTFNFFKFLITAYIGVTLLSNSLNIVLSFFDLGKDLVDLTMGGNLVIEKANVDMKSIKDGLNNLNVIELCGLVIGLNLSKLFLNLMGLVVWALIQIRILQIYFYAATAAVPLSTFSSKEFRNVGFNYLKNLLAYALQGVLIILGFSMYRVLLQQHINEMTGGGDAGSFVLKVIALGIILIALIRQTSVIAKSVVNAT